MYSLLTFIRSILCSIRSILWQYSEVLCDAIFSVGVGNILENVVRLKSDLTNIIEPDFGLLDELLRLEALTRPEFADVRSERTVYRRNAALLDLLTTEVQCGNFLKALKQTGQQHIVNYITQNGGQKTAILQLVKCYTC